MTPGWSRIDGRDSLRLDGEHAVYPSALVDAAGARPMAGSYVRDANGVHFVPRFGFVDGTSYTVVGSGERATIVRRAVVLEPVTSVIDAYPTSAVIPVNHLRFYVQFSGPMSDGCSARHVHAVDGRTGIPLEEVFLPMEPELWDPQRTRLTLLLDPGRIKRGLVPNREWGYPLREGVPVRVVVDASYPDAEGRPLRNGFERRYDVAGELRRRVDPRDWQIAPPTAGTCEPLRIAFDRPLDHGLLQHAIRVEGVGGGVEVGPDELSWRLTPDAPWPSGALRIVVDARLEDHAGNSLARVFDRDLARAEDAPVEMERVELELVCRRP